ncbi:23S rRNA pseudouridine(955/2504/2580) synthase RluC [Planctobacterium marinum]|uniref:23S rRNA pseudouridine(955/2504/2580) synthase RluC n=1 Tax=Planctobacterium marinum TaxID=1631968 RepID=UPI001E31EF9E|nr:23S rRNA pseudouridine(955/2504/2580) synthase RluC [Planctobacterium marinum]MCC2604139.1 23S rRNA pseudouridine(955/2504/2580) synthase RluC [Planctobacterium marinum]
MKNLTFDKVQILTIEPDYEGQRVDNFLKNILKGVPKSMIYRILRKGEVRINKKRVKPEYKLCPGDELRVPPIRVSEEKQGPSANLSAVQNLESLIIHEDKKLIVLNKPHGMAVHGGSGQSFGVIEALRSLRPDERYMELVHRLDRDTSGCLLIAKRRSVLRSLHEQLREKTTVKKYFALVDGDWPEHRNKVKAPLHKNVLQSGERVVKVSEQGKPSETRYNVMERFESATLVEAIPVTGRTHQIRVHCLHAGHPILMDDKYCTQERNDEAKRGGLARMFLHAHEISFADHESGERQVYSAPLTDELKAYLQGLRNAG